ncbi:aldolase catalytic domain-containing protein [Maribacter sp. PR1]|uniref:Aldolase catalytic domain-containing protein n=1 Tax=Maribacter cobaltidurans TaxID=1178778 RepID=A0ABU7IQF3_9FLAO|nr:MULTISPECIES: aldolase catalytic domain-containing protein [Maribacter]MDC6387799.1 aldolase catalytic domain-containing protein [Maribacter sp. PR1]MEE1975187.1 aldolase catalytic domain-containing protein [Maribacter cobaltidurans]
MRAIENLQILDCTLRDGGYYTNWDFSKDLVEEYCRSMEELPIDYVEIGYRSTPLNGYLGEYFYCPDYVMEALKKAMPSKKLVIILDEKNIRVEHLDSLLTSCIPYISMVRMAIDPANFERAITLAKAVKTMGFEVAFNVMYMSSWKNDPSFLDMLNGLDDTIDYFYMVDSYGGIMPQEVDEIIELVKSKTNVTLGFHGHNNLEMALANTLMAIEGGCAMVDATITGMGRGAGNLRTELLLTYLDSKNIRKIKFTPLSRVVGAFESLKIRYGWGTNLPYMFSGAFSLPQKQVMEWVGMNRYPIGSILNALNNQKDSLEDNMKLPVLSLKETFDSAVILGGGKSALNHNVAIKKLVEEKNNFCIIHAGARNVSTYIDIENKQYYALAGFESEKLLKTLGDVAKLEKKTCVYPPFPRNMGTIIPDEVKRVSVELEAIDFTGASKDSPMTLSFQIALDLGVKNIYLAGFDGYDTTIDQIQFVLAQENQNILNDALKSKQLKIIAITPTKYKKVKTTSIYSII